MRTTRCLTNTLGVTFQVQRVSAATTTRAAPRPPFQRFLEAHGHPVFAFLRAMVGEHDAEDCFQETMIAALRGYDEMDGAHPRAWLMTIARHKAIDHHRARARRPEPRGELPEPAAPQARSALGDLDGEVWVAVAGLSEARREAVALRFAADLSYREIAVALGCSEAAARRRVADGLGQLRDTLDLEEVHR